MAMLVITRWYRKGPADSWMSRWQSFAKAQQGSSTPPPALAILAELAPEQLGIAGSAWNKSSTITVVCGSQPSMACPLCTGYTQIPWFSNMLKAKTSSSHIFTIKWQLWGILYPIRRNHIVTARGPSQGWPPLLPVWENLRWKASCLGFLDSLSGSFFGWTNPFMSFFVGVPNFDGNFTYFIIKLAIVLIPLDLHPALSSRKREPLSFDRMDFPADAAAAGSGCVPKSPTLPPTRHFPGGDNDSFGPSWANFIQLFHPLEGNGGWVGYDGIWQSNDKLQLPQLS